MRRLSVILLLLLSCSVRADVFVAQGSSLVKDGFVYGSAGPNNYGGDNRFIIGRGGISIFAGYLWFDLPAGTNHATGPCTLAVSLYSMAANADTFDIYWCTRPNARWYVGNNVGSTADSAEMNFTLLFEGGSGLDTAWISPGGDFTATDRLSSLAIPGGSSPGWYYWVLDSIQIDSLLRGLRANYGLFIKQRTPSSIVTRTEGRSTEYASPSFRPWVKIIYAPVAPQAGVNPRRRQAIFGRKGT